MCIGVPRSFDEELVPRHVQEVSNLTQSAADRITQPTSSRISTSPLAQQLHVGGMIGPEAHDREMASGESLRELPERSLRAMQRQRGRQRGLGTRSLVGRWHRRGRAFGGPFWSSERPRCRSKCEESAGETPARTPDPGLWWPSSGTGETAGLPARVAPGPGVPPLGGVVGTPVPHEMGTTNPCRGNARCVPECRKQEDRQCGHPSRESP